LLAGLILSPGALGIILLIPVITLIMPHVQTRYILTVGFLVLGSAMLFSRSIPPNISFGRLVLVRACQSAGIGFLFVPTSVLAYQTVQKNLQGDATALFTMFRNVSGSVGISLSTAWIQSRTQVHMAYLSANLSPADPVYRNYLQQVTRSIQNLGTIASNATQAAVHQTYSTLIAQAGFLAYKDVFLYCALLSFGFVPLTFLFAPVKATRKAGAE